MNVSHVICIDFEPGIPVRAIAAEVAETVGLPLVDREIVAGETAKLNLPERLVAALEGEPDHPIQRWLLAAAEGDQDLGISDGTTPQTDPVMQPRRPLMRAFREAIQEAATQPCVIANHQACYALAGRHETMRVLLCADPSERQLWLREHSPADWADRDRLVDERDRAQRAYVKQAYSRRWPDLRIYHLTLDVGRLTLERSAYLISEFARSTPPGGTLTK